MSSLDQTSKKILILGFGAVGKSVLHYLSMYLRITENNVYVVDKTSHAFYGPDVNRVHKRLVFLDNTTFIPLLDEIHVTSGDIIIDVTFGTPTYHFIDVCVTRGIHYINTSIEDNSDEFRGGSIHHQQFVLRSMLANRAFSSCIMTECGQNPGLIQHYVLYALHQLYEMAHPDDPHKADEWRKEVLSSMIDQYQIGSILMSERDQLKTSRPIRPDVLYNTWSVGGFLSESLDPAEVIRGTNNQYIQPLFLSSDLHSIRMKQYESYQDANHEVLFLKADGNRASLPSVCPILMNGDITFSFYRGCLIHHGEIFELARYFGNKAPFMSYVYQPSRYMFQSLDSLVSQGYNKDDLLLHVNDPTHYSVMDNITDPAHPLIGFDSIGCTLCCGKNRIERMFWCGSILSNTDPISPYFSPTIVQVAAGVLSGLSYLLEPNRTPGFYEPCDIDTRYMLDKAMPLLGKFFMKEIDRPFSVPFVYEC